MAYIDHGCAASLSRWVSSDMVSKVCLLQLSNQEGVDQLAGGHCALSLGRARRALAVRMLRRRLLAWIPVLAAVKQA